MSKYTQREWDRTVGWGKVPPEYSIEESDKNVQPQEDKPTRDKSKDN
tara:strand:+ start:753 stop:893 length:141 start_codon:yes stop_codon:yes gene_type:complete